MPETRYRRPAGKPEARPFRTPNEFARAKLFAKNWAEKGMTRELAREKRSIEFLREFKDLDWGELVKRAGNLRLTKVPDADDKTVREGTVYFGIYEGNELTGMGVHEVRYKRPSKSFYFKPPELRGSRTGFSASRDFCEDINSANGHDRIGFIVGEGTHLQKLEKAGYTIVKVMDVLYKKAESGGFARGLKQLEALKQLKPHYFLAFKLFRSSGAQTERRELGDESSIGDLSRSRRGGGGK
jgi:hypothetical protein